MKVSTKDQHSSVGSKDDNRASLLVEFIGENENSNLEIKLLTNSCDSYACTLSPGDLSLFSKDQKSPQDQARTLGRLLLREDSTGDGSLTNEWQNKSALFQFENTNDDEHNDLYLLVHENLSNGMKRRILKEKLQRLNNGGIGYAMALGAALNQSLKETMQQTSGRDHWKNTAETLEKLQQQSKDTLLHNFTNLRNKMLQRHQAEIEKLKESHQAEKESWEIALQAAKQQRAPPKRKKKPEAQELSTTNELFDQNEIMALAEGRKLDSGRHDENATQKSPSPRKAFLKPNEVVDMVQIRKEGLEFQNRNHEKRKRAKESRRTESDELGEKEDNRKRNAIAGGNRKKQRKLASPPRVVRESKRETENAAEARRDLNGDSPPWKITKEKPAKTKKHSPPLPPAAADDISTASESSWVLR